MTRRFPKIWLAISLTITISLNAHAEVGFQPEFDDFIELNWSGQGDIRISNDACIFATLGNNFFLLRDYRLKLFPNPPAPSVNSPFAVYDASGTVSVPFSAMIFDLHDNGASQSLQPDVFSNVLNYDGCTIGQVKGNNARLELTFLANNLYQAPAGDYQITFNAEARRANGNAITGDQETQANILTRIRIPSLVRISGVDDIDLGTYDGTSTSVGANESFCIYANTSEYTIKASTATTGDNASEFAIVSGANNLEYIVRVSNTTDASAGQQLDNDGPPAQFAVNQNLPLSLNCFSGDNAAVFVSISGTQLGTAPSGNYAGTLELLVAPI